MENLLKINIQTFAETPEGTEPEITEEEVKEVIPEDVEKVDEVVPFSITEEDYNKGLQSAASKAKHELLKEIGYDRIFAFNYSKRPGTKAFDMEDNVPAEVKSERLNSLFELQDSLYDKKLPSLTGIKTEVLITDINEDKEFTRELIKLFAEQLDIRN